MTTGSALRATRLNRRHGEKLATLLDSDPVVNAYLRSELRLGVDAGDWWGVVDGDTVRAAALAGALVVPFIPRADDALPLAEALAAVAIPRMIVGPRDASVALFNALRRPARELRDPQHVMVVERSTLQPQTPAPVRRAQRGDIEGLIVAAAAMHQEEMGVDPLLIDAVGWRARMTTLVERGWSWVWTQDATVIFKAELSAWTPEVVQIQGVWSHPAYRGQGVGRCGLGAVCSALFEEVALCSLYVNHYNSSALAMYRRLGFAQVAEFATVIY